MPCFKPLPAVRLLDGAIKVYPRSKYICDPDPLHPLFGCKKHFFVPCSQCIGCRLERSRQWAMRCMHESQMHSLNCFITLTYDDIHLPKDGSLCVPDFQKFMKRLRKALGNDKIRFFHCGEYGDKFGRPHYHAIIFGWYPPDVVLWKVHNGQRYFKSAMLDRIWGKGYTVTGDVSFESAAYVARYITKKITGPESEFHYADIDFETGEYFGQIKSEYTTMSRSPGIGKSWYDKFRSDVFPSDFLVVRGKKMRPPKYYDRLYEIEAPSDYLLLKEKRVAKAQEFTSNNTIRRLADREHYQTVRFKQLKRSFDNEV